MIKGNRKAIGIGANLKHLEGGDWGYYKVKECELRYSKICYNLFYEKVKSLVSISTSSISSDWFIKFSTAGESQGK